MAIVEFKWLAAGLGWAVHVERMQHDAQYAQHTLARAATSSSPALVRAATELQRQIDAA